MKDLKGLHILKAEGSLGRLLNRTVKHTACAPSGGGWAGASTDCRSLNWAVPRDGGQERGL